jgi:hypothetical protein
MYGDRHLIGSLQEAQWEDSRSVSSYHRVDESLYDIRSRVDSLVLRKNPPLSMTSRAFFETLVFFAIGFETLAFLALGFFEAVAFFAVGFVEDIVDPMSGLFQELMF